MAFAYLDKYIWRTKVIMALFSLCPSTDAANCVAWRQTDGCDPSGGREPTGDKPCDAVVNSGNSGFCECDGGVTTAGSTCDHTPFTCQSMCRKAGQTKPDSNAPPANANDADCVGWRQTGGCTHAGQREPRSDRRCTETVPDDASGYCECKGGVRTAESGCKHDSFTCADKCAEHWTWMREQQATKEARRAALPADPQAELMKRGKGFWVTGNLELAMRHFQQILRSDPEHKEAKDIYKTAKKLSKLQKSVEELLEGKGKQKEKREAAEEIIKKVKASFDLIPPRVFHPQLYKQLCDAEILVKNKEGAIEACTQLKSLEGGSLESRLSMAEALLLAEKYQDAINEYDECMKLDENNRAAHEGKDKAQKLLKRSKEVDHYKVLGVKRDATNREIKRAYHKLALEYHPDKVVEADKESAEKKFKEVARAYEILSDEEIRKRYDAGEDVEENQGGGGGGGFPHGFNHGGQRMHFHFRQG